MEAQADVFANRDEPLPLLTVSYDDVDTSSSDLEEPDRRSRLRQSSSPTRLKGKAQASPGLSSPVSPSTRQSLQDRMFNKLLGQVLPIDEQDDGADDDYHPSDQLKRPAFSLPVMTNNFRRFNARIGIVFVFQNRMVRLFSWRTPTHTLSFLAVFTFVCLDPYLIIALPLVIALLFIMVPAFVSRHPPPPPSPVASHLVRDHSLSAYSYSGPALAPPRTIKPAPETSKDFFRNMRDLQNSMADFSNLHDALVTTVAPATNFSNEVLSSTLFLYLTILTSIAFISSQLIPFRLVFLLGGYAMTFSGHPAVQAFLIKQQKRAEKRAAQLAQSSEPEDKRSSITISGIPVPLPNNGVTRCLQSAVSAMSQITLSTMPETREVEIFELQHRPILPATSSNTMISPEMYEWTPHLFTSTPFDPLSPSRIAGERPKGARFFEDVQPPLGWEWGRKKWELDLEAGEWVNDRLIVGVEYDLMHDIDANSGNNIDNQSDPNGRSNNNKSPSSGDRDNQLGNENDESNKFDQRRKRKQSVNLDFGGWVWDLPPAIGTTGNREEEVWLAYGDYDIPSLTREKESKKGHKKAGSTASKTSKEKDWEEGVRYGNKGRTGEWRRRRWVRIVKRKALGSGSGAA